MHALILHSDGKLETSFYRLAGESQFCREITSWYEHLITIIIQLSWYINFHDQFLLVIHFWGWIVMATTKIKVSQKLSNKDRRFYKRWPQSVQKCRVGVRWMAQKSNWFFLGSLQPVLCMVNFNFQDMGVSQHLEDEIPHNIRAWNEGKPANVSVHGPIRSWNVFLMCTRSCKRKEWAAAAALTLPVPSWIVYFLN